MDPSSLWTLVTIIISLQTYTQGLPAKRLHHHMTKREIEYYFGVSDHAAVPEYDVTHPYETNEDGDFLSYPRLHSRRRRSSENPNSFYELDAFGSNLHLKLTRNDNLMAPNLQVKRQNEDGTVTSHPAPENTFYLGRVASDPHSTVAVSNHGGLTGLVKTSQDTLFVHPLPAHLAQHVTNEKDTTPHLVYRRSVQVNGALYGAKEEIDRLKRSVDIKDTRNVMDSSNQGKPKYLEAALVAPHSLEEKYKKGNDLSVPGGVSEFLMLVANMVAGMFQDPSIGDRKITYVVTSINIVNITKIGFSRDEGNQQKLVKLIRWAAAQNQSFKESFDAFSYISDGIPSGGIAALNTMCNRVSGNANKEIGLQTSLHVAHETAHNLGVGHDSGGYCAQKSHIMSITLPGGKYATKWSSCSKTKIQEFLANNDRSRCLDDPPGDGRPTLSPNVRDKLPGEVINGDKQCAMHYGSSFRRYTQENCGQLQCINNQGVYLSRLTVVADGTKCGLHNWCISGVCENSGTGSDEVDGGWTSWSAFSKCSHPCGVGIKLRHRTCTNPRPLKGKTCSGRNVEEETCNRQSCQSGEKGPASFKIQCSQKTNNSVPYIKDLPCSLRCRVGLRVYFHGSVEDGTRCKTDTIKHGLCILGGCVPVGCDHVLRSGINSDRCGICGGNGTECYVIRKTYIDKPSLKGPENPGLIVELPVGTFEAYFAMKKFSKNYIGVQDDLGNYLVKGPTIGRQFKAAGGARIYYERKKRVGDKLQIVGRTTAPLRVVFINVAGKNPGVQYLYKSYYGQNGDVAGGLPGHAGPGSSPVHVFQWVIGSWTDCSRTCAIGKKTRDVHCILKEDNSSASDSACPTPVPAKVEQCNVQPCIASWSITYWTPCSKTCGKGKQEREIKCLHQVSEDNYQPTDSCLPEDKPTVDTTRICNKYPCPAEWSVTSWSACSTKCAIGTKYRDVTCTRIDEEGASTVLVEEFCRYKVKYEAESSCNDNEPCGPRPTTCPADHDCSNGGVCKPDSSGYKCDCALGYHGLECEIKLNPCDKHPCLNGGTCTPGPVSDHYTHTCTCPQYTTGRNCEVKIKACDDMPCKNGGTCTDNGDPVKYTCTCNGGFLGARCQVAEVFAIGCFVAKGITIPELLEKRKREIDMANTNPVALNCAELAQENGFKYFLVGVNGKCFSGLDAGTMYYNKGSAARSKCSKGVGKAGAYFVYTFEPLPAYASLGCYRAKKGKKKALANKYISFRNQINNTDKSLTVKQCARVAHNRGFKYFAVENLGDCYTDVNAESKYDSLGRSTKCAGGVGQKGAIMVYAYDDGNED